jgi:hypothetical protein
LIRTAGRSATPLDIPPLAVSPPQICGGHVLLNVMATIALWRDSARKPCDVIECSFSPRSPLAWQYVTVPIIEDRHRRVRTSRLLCSGINDELWDGTGCQAGYYFLGQSGDMALCAKRLPRRTPPDAPHHARWRSIGRRIMAKGGINIRSASVQVFGRRDDDPSTRSYGRRPKSAKARNRVMWGVAVPRAMAILTRAQSCGWRNGAATRRIWPRGMSMMGSANERRGFCTRRFCVFWC